jgi:hypothetical protein
MKSNGNNLPISDLRVLKSEILDDIIRGLLGNREAFVFNGSLSKRKRKSE